MENTASSPLTFLKLGGSLITDKRRPHTARLEVLERLGEEIAEARAQDPALRLVLGHGSGSFGHVPASKYGTRQGVHTAEEWRGFVEVWREAAALDHLVLAALGKAGVAALAFPPSALVTAQDGQVASWNLEPLKAALEAGITPVVYGDVVFDTLRGGTILSTEDLFAYLGQYLRPARLLLAGLEAGVWADYPQCTRLIDEITPTSLPEAEAALGGSEAADVTGGMESKVRETLRLVEQIPGLEGFIFSGETPGNLRQALLGARMGTALHG
jgi:isopentenyl phosphate kinase